MLEGAIHANLLRGTKISRVTEPLIFEPGHMQQPQAVARFCFHDLAPAIRVQQARCQGFPDFALPNPYNRAQVHCSKREKMFVEPASNDRPAGSEKPACA
jgi:hypothetical protein